MNEGVIFCIVGLVVFLIVKGISDSYRDKRYIYNSLISSWGVIPDTQYYAGKLESIEKFYDSVREGSDVDDITWNDLDGIELYKMMNNTGSSAGEEYLYSMLRKPVYDTNELTKRNIITEYFSFNADERIAVQTHLKKIGKDKKLSFFEHFNKLDNVNRQSNLIHYVIIAIWVISVTGLILNFIPSIFLMVFNLAFSIITYYKRKAEIESYYYIFLSVLRMLYSSKNLSKLDVPVIDEELKSLKEDIKTFNSFKRYSGIVLSPDGGNILDIIVDYIRMLFHIDLIKFNNMYRFISDNKETVRRIFEKIGYIDALISVASFREAISEQGWCVPEYVDDDKVLEFEDAYHLFLSDPVRNSYKTSGECMLLTGSNASGKSTFLKMTAMNAIMAQTVMTVTAKKYRTSYYKVMTSMALSDNIFRNQSYFIVELESLKRLFDSVGEIPILCCIDEVLRGTNTNERIAASAQVLKMLSTQNVLCFAATHDIELASILQNYYTNYNFHESIEGDNVVFDYKLYNGSSKTKNAIKLLGMMGFSEDITHAADEEATYFENNNRWNVFD